MTKSLAEKMKFYRLNQSEYEFMCKLLKRPPKEIEWPLFSALWSEHCSYKSSKIHLKKFAKTMNSKVQNASGENAGVIDIGFGEKIAFKMESHNHPSYIEPFQGAATGVGGILRDIFTMGARPIALANFLCFGEMAAPRMKSLVRGVVHGISSYGNCVGVPTLTGKTQFAEEYNQNILVNAMAVGYFSPNSKVALSAAKGPGNWVVYVGAKTGKDGVHGAAMASESFDEDSDSKRPNIQIGDPYFEKLLIESCLEIIQKDLVVAIQDMGAAGLTSSSFEMASKGQVGMEIHLDRVPTRDASITPEELLLSESQERMLLVCEPNKFEEIQQIMQKWGLDAVQIGTVIPDRIIKLIWRSEILTEIDPDLLVENAPVYERAFDSSSPMRKKSKENKSSAGFEIEFDEKSASKKWIFRQYDQRVGLRTAMSSESGDIGVLRLESGRALGIALGCRVEMMKMNSRFGAMDAVIYPALQMAAKGIKALAVTDCLNFANPEKKEVMTDFVESVEGIVQASLALDAPVISGNVSFYNETLGKGIVPTPAIGLIGLRDSIEDLPKDYFSEIGSKVFVVSVEFLKTLAGIETKEFSFDLQVVQDLQKLLLSLDHQNLIKSSRVVGARGLGETLVKMSLQGFALRGAAALASENIFKAGNGEFYQVVIETNHCEKLKKEIQKFSGISWEEIGETCQGQFKLGEREFDLQKLKQEYFGKFEQALQGNRNAL